MLCCTCQVPCNAIFLKWPTDRGFLKSLVTFFLPGATQWYCVTYPWHQTWINTSSIDRKSADIDCTSNFIHTGLTEHRNAVCQIKAALIPMEITHSLASITQHNQPSILTKNSNFPLLSGSSIQFTPPPSFLKLQCILFFGVLWCRVCISRTPRPYLSESETAMFAMLCDSSSMQLHHHFPWPWACTNIQLSFWLFPNLDSADCQCVCWWVTYKLCIGFYRFFFFA